MKQFTILWLAIVTGLTACRDETTAPRDDIAPSVSQAASRALNGWFHTQWGDPPSGKGSSSQRYVLIDDQGGATELLLDEGLVAPPGGSLALDRKRVRISGDEVAVGRMQVHALELDPAAGAAVAALAPILGSRPFVTIGCKFSDAAQVPHALSTYRTWTAGGSYPGLNHYWPEVSYNKMNVTGSTVVGWYTLPHPRAYYVSSSGADLRALALDCTRAADPYVNFPNYYGINLQFNKDLGSDSYGGSWTLTADGQTKTYGMTWMADWAELSTYAHQEGHAFGLKHSSAKGGTSQSDWDVMSNPYVFFDGAWGTYIPQHTISYHKDLLGWIPAGRKYTVPANSVVGVDLACLALPGAGTYLMAKIPLDDGSGRFYTVEYRCQNGKYDGHTPERAVILHFVDPTRGDNVAQVAAELKDEYQFIDARNVIRVDVEYLGFPASVRITTGQASNTWITRASLPAPRSSFALGTTSTLLYAVGGRSNGVPLTSVVAYNPATNIWYGKAGLPAARYDGDGATAIGTLLYLPGGRNAAGALTSTLYAYNLSTNVWSTKAALPTVSGCGASGVINGVLYVLTGCDGTSGFKARLHRYTPATNTWAALASAPAAHGYPAAAVINGLIYVAGGKNAGGAATATLHVYNPGTNTWSSKASMPSARFGAGGWAVNGKLYVVGGTNAQGSVVATTLVYDPVTNLWSTKAPVPAARTNLGAGGASGGGLLYAVGGRSGTGDLTSVVRYRP